MTSWRDHLAIHPAAELFPLMSEPELRELGQDIKANGLASSIGLYKGKLLDGRNRLDAMELVGIKFGFVHRQEPALRNKLDYLHFCDSDTIKFVDHFDSDPHDFVLSANIHRRHLNAEDKRDLIAKVLKAKPEASTATVAKQVKADDKTVAKVRRKLESTSEIPKLEKTTGADGKKRKSRTPRARGEEAGAGRASHHCIAGDQHRTAPSGECAAGRRAGNRRG
jgi:hypothetical protein